MKTIAILITNFEGGGAQRIALTHAREFQRLGYTVEVVALEHQESYAIPEDLSVTFLTPGSGTDSKLKKALTFPTLPHKLAQFLQDKNIDICISHLERADFINILAKPLAKHPTICVIHSHLSANYFQEGITVRSLVYMGLVKSLERFSNRLAPVSHGIAADLVSLGLPADKITVIHNPFDISAIQEASRQDIPEYQDILFGHPTIISIGRLSRQKGFWHSLKAFQHQKKTNPDLQYLILGDGPMRDWHLEYATNLGLKVYHPWSEIPLDDSYDVYFLGFVQNPHRFLARATAFVLPSHYEGLPNVIIESLICGTPVIASDCDAGPRELLAPETDISTKATEVEYGTYGILTPLPRAAYEKDVLTALSPAEQAISQAIQRLLKDTDLQDTYRTKSQERIQQFQLSEIIPQWEELLRELQ